MEYTILGSSGFIGSHLVRELSSGGTACFLPEKGHAFSKKKNLGHVVYCIGLTSDFRQRPMDTVRAHVTELMRVLENSTFESFLYLSSTRVYAGSNLGTEDQALLVNPSDPSDLYNISKLMGESVCLSIGNEKVKVARLSNVIGSDFHSENFLFSLLRDALKTGEIKLGVPLAASKDYVAIDDVVMALIAIATSGQKRIYNVASGMNITNQAIVDEIAKHTGCSVQANASENHLRFPAISIARLADEFAYRPSDILQHLGALIEEAKFVR